jgi:SAM-dependent methyltransferase
MDTVSMFNSDKCRLCGSQQLTKTLHLPNSSKVSLRIVQCTDCNLVQGMCDEVAYEIENDTYKDPSLVLSEISCDSPYSNIRVGKQQMAEKFFDVLGSLPLDIEKIQSVLDVRSARGSFILKSPDYFKAAKTFVGLEEDLYLHPPSHQYCDTNVAILDYSVYNFPSQSQKFDFVYSCHTLEHYRNPNRYLQNIKRFLSPNGYFFLDIPSLSDFIEADVLDDFFYDKHLLYFTELTIFRLLNSNGFDIIWHRSSGNGCIELLVQLENKHKSKHSQDSTSALVKSSQVSDYSKRLANNRAKLSEVSENIGKFIPLSNSKYVAFGAGRILDAFKVYGDLDLRLFDYFVDNYLFEASRMVNGFSIQRLSDLNPELDLTFILFTRTNSKPLARMIYLLYPSAKIFHWSDFKHTYQPSVF